MIAPKVAKPTPAEEREAYRLVTIRDNDTCQRCLRNCGPSNRDHRQDRSVGGRTSVVNLQILGGSGTTGCHGWKTANPRDAQAEGWAVPGWADPHEYPARRWLPTFGTGCSSSRSNRRCYALHGPGQDIAMWKSGLLETQRGS